MQTTITTPLLAEGSEFAVKTSTNLDAIGTTAAAHLKKAARVQEALKATADGGTKLQSEVYWPDGTIMIVCTTQNPGESEADWVQRHRDAVAAAKAAC